MVEGRIDKYFKEICLLEQPWIKDPDKTIQQLLNEKIAAIGENINIRRFVRYERGEGIEKRKRILHKRLQNRWATNQIDIKKEHINVYMFLLYRLSQRKQFA